MAFTNPAWVDPIEATFDEGKPIRSKQGLMLAGNPIAIAQGAAGAPRVQADAMQGSVAGDTVLFGTGGPDVIYTTGDFVQDATFRATTDCEVRLKFEHRSDKSAPGNVTAQVYKNGSVVFSHSTSSSSYSTQSVDITLAAGDMVRLKGGSRVVQGDIARSQFRNITYRTGSQRSVGGI